MPQVTISTYGTVLDGVKVQKIFCEENVKNITKEVSIFEKYSSKNAKLKMEFLDNTVFIYKV